ncbi:MAG: M48 family metallopeptidase [Candidatus Omnitrophica bacterium]|nr:M48 family metallopeptidase [Candidatus Omnitrophota bacterium]
MMPAARSDQYHRVKNRMFFSGLFLDFAFLMIFFFAGWSLTVRNWTFVISSNFWIANGLYVFLFSSLLYLLHLPLNFFLGYIWEHKFQLSNQNFFQWWTDDLKQSALGLVMVVVLVEVVYFFLRHFPSGWWICAWIFWVFMAVIMAKITPNVIIPIFYKYVPINNASLKDRIFDMFKKCKVFLQDVYMIDMSQKTKKANAFVCGIGRTRRVVLGDTLVNQYTVDEIEAVVAHELGHYVHRDIFKLLIVNGIVIFVGFYLIALFLNYSVGAFHLRGIDDIAFLPMITVAFVVFSLATAIPLNAFSRYLEKQADLFCLTMTQKPADFISLMKKLGEMNLAKENPSLMEKLFFYDHPPLKERIAVGEKFKVTK